MSAQYFRCPRCKNPSIQGSRFCSTCGLSYVPNTVPQPVQQNFAASPKKSNLLGLWIALGAVGLCGFCGIIGSLTSNKDAGTQQATTTQQQNNSNAQIQATPTPPPTFAEIKAKAQPMLAKDFVPQDLNIFEEVMKPLREMPKDSKDYKEGKKLLDQLINKTAVIAAERLVLGKKPENSPWDGSVRPAENYLKQTLNDYDSSEYLGWTQVAKVYIGKEPYWATKVKLRAKNAFGAYIVKDVYFLIRNDQVVKVEGL